MNLYEQRLDAKLARLGLCRCGHMACEHWHGGPIKDLYIGGCGRCKCKEFVRRATLIVEEPKRRKRDDAE